jgi:hypothetical protein
MAYLVSNTSDSLFGPGYDGPFRKFDFTLLFEDTILTIVPATLFLVAASVRAVWLTSKPNKVTTSLSRSTKLVRHDRGHVLKPSLTIYRCFFPHL